MPDLSPFEYLFYFNPKVNINIPFLIENIKYGVLQIRGDFDSSLLRPDPLLLRGVVAGISQKSLRPESPLLLARARTPQLPFDFCEDPFR